MPRITVERSEAEQARFRAMGRLLDAITHFAAQQGHGVEPDWQSFTISVVVGGVRHQIAAITHVLDDANITKHLAVDRASLEARAQQRQRLQ